MLLRMSNRICLSVTLMAALSGCDELAVARDVKALVNTSQTPAPAASAAHDAKALAHASQASAPAASDARDAKALAHATTAPAPSPTIDAHAVGVPAPSISAWHGGRDAPRFADFNGDGALDVFGWVLKSGGRQSLVAAFDGKTGAVLWTTPVLTDKAHESAMRLVAGRIVVVDASGRVQAFKPGDATSAWQTELGEQAEQICSGGPDRAVIQTADKRILAIDLLVGAARPATLPTPCTTDEAVLPAVIRSSESVWADSFSARRRLPTVEGIDSKAELTVSADVRVVFGEKSPGTPVPMLAMLRGKQVAWSVAVPATEPLQARMSMDAIGAADERGVFVVYTQSNDERVAAFAAADGRRLWDLAMPDASVVVPVEDRVYIVQPVGLAVVDRETGALRHVIGRTPG